MWVFRTVLAFGFDWWCWLPVRAARYWKYAGKRRADLRSRGRDATRRDGNAIRAGWQCGPLAPRPVQFLLSLRSLIARNTPCVTTARRPRGVATHDANVAHVEFTYLPRDSRSSRAWLRERSLVSRASCPLPTPLTVRELLATTRHVVNLVRPGVTTVPIVWVLMNHVHALLIKTRSDVMYIECVDISREWRIRVISSIVFFPAAKDSIDISFLIRLSVARRLGWCDPESFRLK